MESSRAAKVVNIQKNQHIRLISIKYLSPTVLLFFAALFFFLVLIVIPMDVQYPLSAGAMLFWFVCLIGFLGGTLLGAGGRFKMRAIKAHASPSTLKFFLLKLVLIGLAGSILLLVDRYMIRGVSLGADMLENRRSLGDTDASVVSVIAAIASSIGIFSYILIWIIELRAVAISRWIKILAIINLFIALAVSIQMGSRSLLLVMMLIHIVAWFFVFRMQGKKIRVKQKVALLFILLLLAVISSGLMIMRVELMGFSMLDSITSSGYAYTIQPPSFVLSYLQDDGNQWAAVLAGMFSLVQYVFHGIYEFSLLFNNFQSEHEMGGRTLWLPIKVLSTLTGGWVSIGGVEHIGERSGVFTTFVGPVFIDFGWLSPVALVVFGTVVGLPFRLLQKGRVEWLPSVVIVATGMILCPVVNIFSSASGTYLLVGAVVVGLTGKRLRTV